MRISDGSWRKSIVWAIALVVGFGCACALDRPIWQALPDPQLRTSETSRLFRAAGLVTTHALFALALVLCDWPLRTTHGLGTALRRGGLLILSSGLSGALAEALKLVLRRHRPFPTRIGWDGEYSYIPWRVDPFDAGHMGLPSGHAATAFGAAWMLCLLFPRATPVWLFFAAGCVYSRILDQKHFLSDAYYSMVLAGAVALALWRAAGAMKLGLVSRSTAERERQS
ncbi:MAG: phosphatase PAP2 family protein [Planctomycetota bacterium]